MNNPIIYKFFEDFTDNRRKTNRAAVFSCRLLPNILRNKDQWWDLPTIWKKESFRHIMKNPASMYESSGSQYFRTTTGIQSRSDAFDETSFVKSFFTILGVTVILRSFRLVLEGKIGKGIPESSRLEFLEKLPGNLDTHLIVLKRMKSWNQRNQQAVLRRRPLDWYLWNLTFVITVEFGTLLSSSET